jgi:hypothetical protein
MSRLLSYCEEKILEARLSKDRAIKYLAALETTVENWGPMGIPSKEDIEKKTQKAKYYIDFWEKEIQIWEAEKETIKV